MKRDLAVALVSDFFYPSLGGVEVHIKEQSQMLKGMVRKVIVITHCYPPDYSGVMDIGGVRTYYLPFTVLSNSNVVLPNCVTDYGQAKQILQSEGIDIVHTHQSTSPLGIAFGMQAYHLGLRVVHTQHSLFEFKKMDGIIIPWVLTPVHQLYDKFICVSRATRNNLIIRNKQHSRKSIVIPNSVSVKNLPGSLQKKVHSLLQKEEDSLLKEEEDNSLQKESSQLQKEGLVEDKSCIRLVLCSRMVFRRGIDILIELLPELCQLNQDILIELIGDGPKLQPLKQMIRIQHLQHRAIIHGGQPNHKALVIVKRCDIFLNTALTESFGIAIVEAASLGLHVITSNVGGVGEVLPPQHMHIAALTKDGFLTKIQEVVEIIRRERETKQDTSRDVTKSKEGDQEGVAKSKQRDGVCEKESLNLYPPEKVFVRVTEVYEEVMSIPRESKVPQLLHSLLIKGNLISCLILFLLLVYTVWDLLEAIAIRLKQALSGGGRGTNQKDISAGLEGIGGSSNF